MTSSFAKTFIIILSFNAKKHVLACLARLKNLRVKIVLVDNASTNNTVAAVKKLAKNYQQLVLIENKTNLGFAAGNNVGIAYALKNGAQAVLLLNQDVLVNQDFLQVLFNNKADIVSPVIRSKRNHTWVYDYGGKINRVLGRTSHIESGKYVKNHFPSQANQALGYVSGCCMLIKKPVFDQIGFLNPKYFLYFEDVDFCLRAKKAGFNLQVEPGSLVTHRLKEGRQKSSFNIYHLLRSNLIFIHQYVPLWRRPLAYGYWLALTTKFLLTRI